MRLRLVIGMLLIAALACTFTGDDDETDAQPTQQLIGQNPTPIPTRILASATPQPTATTFLVPTPSCSIRSDWPTISVQAGDTLFAIAQRSGSSVSALVSANCLTNENSIRVGQLLHVPVALPPTSTPFGTPSTGSGTTSGGTIPTNCTSAWFFGFNTTVTEPRCPGTLVNSAAAGQDFEGGRAIWYEAGGIFSARLIYVIFNDGGWSEYGDTWNTSLPYNDPNIVPPAGRYQPVAGIGYLWRTQPGLREKLGWAYEPEQAFNGRRQEPVFGTSESTYTLYIDHGKRGLVLRLTKPLVGSGEQRWIVAGGY